MSKEIAFRAGQFQRFFANQYFHFGPLERDIEQGTEIEFDGTTMRFVSGEEHTMPKLRAVISAGWLIPEGTEAEDYRPKPAGIMVRPADELKARDEKRTGKHSMDMVGHEEQVVTSHIYTNSGAQIGSGNRIADDHPSQHQVSVGSGGTLGAQGGKIVGGIGSASGAVVGAEGEAVGRAGMTVTASNLGRLRSEQKKREEEFGKRQIVSSSPKGTDVADLLEEENPELAAQLRSRRAEAKASEAKVGGHPNDSAFSTEDVDSDLEDLWEKEGPVKVVEDPQPKVKLKAKGASSSEKKELASFEWNKTRHWSKRVSDAVNNYADKPRFLRKILAIETPSVAEKIEAKLEELGL